MDFAKHDKSKVTATTPTANHLFEANETTTQMSEEIVRVFHNVTAKASFLCK